MRKKYKLCGTQKKLLRNQISFDCPIPDQIIMCCGNKYQMVNLPFQMLFLVKILIMRSIFYLYVSPPITKQVLSRGRSKKNKLESSGGGIK